MQSGKLDHFPIIPMGEEFWRPLATFLEDTMLRAGKINLDDVQFIHRVGSVQEAILRIRLGETSTRQRREG